MTLAADNPRIGRTISFCRKSFLELYLLALGNLRFDQIFDVGNVDFISGL